MEKHLVAPSILAANFSKLGDEIHMINQSVADWIHFDVMDGSFVPNISFGIPVLKAVKKIAKRPVDVHLMIREPEKHLQLFRDSGADHLTIHQEACIHLDRTLHQIAELGLKAGVALNPSTPIQSIQHVLHLCDIVCLMSVNPGYGGQKFIPYTHQKIRELSEMIRNQGTPTRIQIDGGVTLDNAQEILSHGADVLVAGSTVFSASNPQQAIEVLKNIPPSSGNFT